LAVTSSAWSRPCAVFRIEASVSASARARGRHGGRKFELTKNQIRLAQSAMANRETHVEQLCEELDISRATLYRYVGPNGAIRGHALKALEP